MEQLSINKQRFSSVDILRGIVMVIMALDHVRDFYHNDAMVNDPLNLSTTTPILFFTRWITHFCAPAFVFLSGVSARIAGVKKSPELFRSFLLKRGLWLIAVDMVLMSLALTFNPLYNVIILQVIWAIGISMIFLALLSRLPVKIIFLISLVILFAHNAFDGIVGSQTDFPGILWRFVHGTTTFLPLGKTHVLFIAYSFLPWTGILLLGYCVGHLFTAEISAERRSGILFRAGLATTAFFILLRYANFYGDPVPWAVQKTSALTFLSFLNLNKYPPSLLYTAMTLGPSMILLSVFEQAKNAVTDFFTVYGKVPFFYYILHFYLIHLSVVVVFFLSGYGVQDIIPPNLPFLFRPQTFGFSLGIVYLIWITLVLLLYPLCKKFGRYKATHRQWWLSYV